MSISCSNQLRRIKKGEVRFGILSRDVTSVHWRLNERINTRGLRSGTNERKSLLGTFLFLILFYIGSTKQPLAHLQGLYAARQPITSKHLLKSETLKSKSCQPPLSSSWSDPICLHKVRKIIEKSLYLAGHTVPPPSYQKTIPTPIWDVGAHILWKQSISYEILF